MEELTQHVKDLVECLGGVAVGIATTKTLEGGPAVIGPSLRITGGQVSHRLCCAP